MIEIQGETEEERRLYLRELVKQLRLRGDERDEREAKKNKMGQK